MKALTFSQYRTINMLMLSFAFSVVEFFIAVGANLWYPELPYTLSLAVVFIGLELMRWKGFGVVSALTSALVFCFASGASGEQYLIYCVGNLAGVGALVFLKFVGYEKVRLSPTLTMVYAVILFVLLQVGRWIVSTALGHDPLLIVQFLSTDALSGLFGIIVILISRNVDGLFENQRHYLYRIEEERKVKENGGEL